MDATQMPPVIASAKRNDAALKFFAVVAAAVIGAKLSIYFQAWVPKCSFKAVTGLPCAFCGGTRALRSIADLNWNAALHWNPLVTIAVACALVAFPFWLVLPAAKSERLIARGKRLPVWPISIALVALNWIYLILFLPR